MNPQNQTNNSAQLVNAEAQLNIIASLSTLLDVRCPGTSFAKSHVNGIAFYAGDYRVEQAGKLRIDFCFDQIDKGDWTIDQSHIVDRQGHKAYPTETELLEVRFPPTIIDGKTKQEVLELRVREEVKRYYIDAEPDNTVGRRFISVTYDLPSDFDQSNFTVVVKNIVAYPNEGEQCSDIHISKVQQVLDERQTGIKIQLKTDISAGGGMCGFEVKQKPADMSFEEAMSIAGNRELLIDLYGIRGPWIFWGSVR